MGRRKADDHVDDPDALSAAALAKRQRVSMACDRCRSAKSKCNGDQPCSACDNQMKPCVYTHTARKRGIPTGYLKSVESCMAWLFEKYPGSEEALRRQLRNNNRKNGKRILLPKAEGADHLRRRWAKSCISGDIVNLLSEPEPEPDASWDYTDTPEKNSAANHLSESESASITPKGTKEHLSIPDDIYDERAPRHEESTSAANRSLMLPRDWRRLINIFFDYTSCWLPIVSREQVLQTATRYHLHGQGISPSRSSALDAELWAVLAVASFHRSSSEIPNGGTDLSPSQIYAIACHFTILNNEDVELPRIRAFLLQSLLLLGQQKTIEAWALISKASRLALSKIPGPTAPSATSQIGLKERDGELSQIIAASFILDTLASLPLGRAEVAASAYLGPPFNISDRLLIDMEASDPAHTSIQSDSNAVFQQLYTFCRMWLLHQSSAQRVPSAQEITIQSLLQSLEGRFSFCNSLVLESSGQAPPFKFLLQAMFLSISLDMASGPRPALILNLLELIEANVQAPNILSIPPLTTTIMSIAGRHLHNTQMFGDIQTRWDAAFRSVYGIWRNSETSCLSIWDSPDIGRATSSPRMGEITIIIGRTPSVKSGTHGISETPSLVNVVSPQVIDRRLPRLDAHGDDPAGLTAIPSEISAPKSSEDKEHEVYSEPLHDLLEELGSVDYADATNADSFFLSNLGFGPECNLEDFFPSDLMTGLE